MILSLSKKIAVSGKAMRTIPNMERRLYEGNDIRGKTLGIIGIGNIGTRVAELCRGLFQMTILAYDPFLTAEQISARGAVKPRPICPDLLRQSDYVTVHCSTHQAKLSVSFRHADAVRVDEAKPPISSTPRAAAFMMNPLWPRR